jgi:acyl carrier protein
LNRPGQDAVSALALACSELLGLDPDLDVSFFDLGGDSMQVLALIRRLRDELDIPLDIADVYQAATLRDLADVLTMRASRGHSVPVGPLGPPSGPDEPFPALWSQVSILAQQRRAWETGEQPLPYLVGPLIYRIDGAVDGPALRDALDAVVRKHEALRVEFNWRGETPTQAMAFPSGPSMVLSDAASVGQAVEAFTLAFGHVFRPAETPRVRAALYRVTSVLHVLCLIFDHLAIDNEGLQIVLRDLSAWCRGFERDQGSWNDIPPPSYRDYAIEEHRHFSGAFLEAGLDFWREKLGGCVVPAVSLPFAAEPDHRSTAHPIAVKTPISDDLVLGLLSLARACRCTPFCILLTAVLVLLLRYTGEPQAVITPTANRNGKGAERLVACVAHHVVYRCQRLSPQMTWLQAIRATWEEILEVQPHSELPYPLLMSAMAPDQLNLPRRQLWVQMNLVETPDSLSLPGARVTQLETPVARVNPATLDVHFTRERERWGVQLWSNPTVVANPHLSAMARDLLRTLATMVASPRAGIADADLELSPAGEE